MNDQTLPPEAETFLRHLRLGLDSLPREERDDIVAEVRSHLLERRANGKTPLLEGFEDPQTYASRFVSETALRDALARGTSVHLGKALLTGAATGIAMLLTVVPLLVLQLLGGALVLVGALKPFMPAHVGVFVDQQGRLVAIGAYGGDVEPLRELLGYWAIPLFVFGGIAIVWACNRALRFVATRRLGASRARPLV
ncbi:MAG: DUF1700 domain-containing protein [Polyangiaceae bacterium]|nr:DUF1700 domain-containing protein [Polyangiaceae bacterium]